MREFVQTTVVPRPVDEVFEFFSVASNLNALTPPWLSFEILTPLPIVMEVGTVIDYQIRLKGVPMKWKSKISVWEPGVRFVDEQIKGPYRSWTHTHMFEACPEGTKMTDRVKYEIGIGPFEGLLDLIVRRDVSKIFRHRTEKLDDIFGPQDNPSSAKSIGIQV